MRNIIIKECYEKAENDMIISDACDVFEKDMIKMLWDQMDIYELLVYNRDKYMFVYGKMPEPIYNELVKKIKSVAKDLEGLLDEITSHRDLTVVRIKSFVDDRTKSIINLAAQNKRTGIKKIQSYDLHITQTIKDDGMDLASMNLPRPIRRDEKVDNIFKESNPYDKISDDIETMKNSNLSELYGDDSRIYYDNGNEDDQKFVINKATTFVDNSKLRRRKLKSYRNKPVVNDKIVRDVELQELRKRFERRHAYSNRKHKYNLV